MKSILSKRCYILLGLVMLITLGMSVQAVAQPQSTRVIRVGAFDRIEASGPVVLNLYSGPQSVRQMLLQTSRRRPVQLNVRNRVLLINVPAQSRAAYTIYSPRLNSITLSAGAKVVGRNAKTRPLTLNVSGNSQLIFTGNPVLISQINAAGNAKVNIRWVRADSLGVNASGNAEINLAGIAQVLHARVGGEADLKAEHLRAQTVWAQAQARGLIQVMALQRLDGFASDDAKIFYYKRPVLLNTYTKQSGVVLQWRHWR